MPKRKRIPIPEFPHSGDVSAILLGYLDAHVETCHPDYVLREWQIAQVVAGDAYFFGKPNSGMTDEDFLKSTHYIEDKYKELSGSKDLNARDAYNFIRYIIQKGITMPHYMAMISDMLGKLYKAGCPFGQVTGDENIPPFHFPQSWP